MKADIGLIGLAVMGENLVLNMESKGFTVAVFNRTVEKVDKFMAGRGAGKKTPVAVAVELDYPRIRVGEGDRRGAKARLRRCSRPIRGH